VSARRGTGPAEEALDVNRFWFGPAPLTLQTINDRQKLWFGVCATPQQQAAVDDVIRRRFGAQMQRAAAGELGAWAASPRRCLALVLLLDQFPRSAFRGTPRAFATDERALALALSAVQAAADAVLSPIERVFLCMPLQHAERLDAQEESLAAYRRLLQEAPGQFRPFLAGVQTLAERRHSIVARFGRFPDRNRILGRESTLEEIGFLAASAADSGSGS
jgi:uncharacterized protein (DUF924 family)